MENGNLNDAVDAVVAFLHARRENANHFEANAVDSDVLAEGVLAGKQLGLGFGTDHGDARLGFFVFFVEELALVDVHGLDLEHAGINSLDVEGVAANVVLHGRLLIGRGRDAAYHGAQRSRCDRRRPW